MEWKLNGMAGGWLLGSFKTMLTLLERIQGLAVLELGPWKTLKSADKGNRLISFTKLVGGSVF